jgi:threonine/homoserine/homoserine lactone efflux protein
MVLVTSSWCHTPQTPAEEVEEVNFAAFLGVSILVIVAPGQDTALTIRNTLFGGRGAGLATAAGVSSGQFVWTLLTSAGLAGLLLASEPVFTSVRLAGAAYLVFLGAQALYSAIRPQATGRPGRDSSKGRINRVSGYRQGVFSNLGNPKMVVFFSSLLPQFLPPGQATFSNLLMLGLIFNLMTLTWLMGYACVVARVGDVLRRDRVRRGMEAVSGLVLVGLGMRLATERR